MTSTAIAAKFLIITLLGILAFITFLVTLTILGLMVVDPTGCGDCLRYPVGVWALGILGLFFVVSMGVEWAEARQPMREWLDKNPTTAAVAIIVVLVFLYIFSRG